MTDATKMDEAPGMSQADRRAKRRERLRMLRGQFAEVPAPEAPSEALAAPTAPGSYLLEVEMVKEFVYWFPQYVDTAVTVG